MTFSPTQLRAEAEALARQLPGPSVRTRDASAVHAGSAGRRRAGTGEDFWQYRHHTPEDGAGRVDWRRSARGDDLYVRETELETARTFYVWSDPDPGFDWKGPEATVTKADRARLILTALAARLSRTGERVGVVGGQTPGFGGKAVDRIAEGLVASDIVTGALPAPRRGGTALIASDFYDPKPGWKDKLASLAGACRGGVLLAVSDPTELVFPFEGRVELSRPGSDRKRLLERAEKVREAYFERLSRHRRDLEDLARTLGWSLVTHDTSQAALVAASHCLAALENIGVDRAAPVSAGV